MSLLISNLNSKTKNSNTAAIKDNLNYIKKFGLPTGVIQYINSCLIFNDVHIDDPTIAFDIEH